MTDATWLPNLVGGTSIWKLAVDLNEPKFFDGRLLVPETEGSESLPVTVRWDLTGLVPLRDARKEHADAVGPAIAEFHAALERVAKVFATPNSGFDKYKDAFTVPSLEADDGAHYFFSPSKNKLYVINWGASPRSMGGRAEYVFGYEDWARRWGGPAAGAALVAITPVAVEQPVANGAPEGAAAKPEKPEKPEKKKREPARARAWWFWPLFGLLAIVLVLLALFLLKACGDDSSTGAGAGDAGTDAAALGAGGEDAALGAGDDADDGGADDGGADDADAGTADAAAHDAGADAEAASDAGPADGGVAAGDGGAADGDAGPEEDDDHSFLELPPGSSGGAGPSGGPVIVRVGPGGGQRTGIHRDHYSDDAHAWRVSAGAHKVSRTEQAGKRFDVWLMPGKSFEGVRVEWQDAAGNWHVH